MASDLLERTLEQPSPSREITLRAAKRMSASRRNQYARALPQEQEATLNQVSALLEEKWSSTDIAVYLRYSTRHTRRLIQRVQRRRAEAKRREETAASLPRAVCA